ncbi:MAG: hypothetical protein NVSMB23_17510 [Myxococcales bacterium]
MRRISEPTSPRAMVERPRRGSPAGKSVGVSKRLLGIEVARGPAQPDGRILTTGTRRCNRGTVSRMARLRVKSLVWIVRPAGDGAAAEVLLLERPGERGGGLHPVTGNADRGEAPSAAAVREALEETGLRGDLVDLCFRHEFANAHARFVEHAFLLAVAAGAQFALSDEHVHALWTPGEDAHARIAWDAHRATLRLALEAWAARAGAARLQRGG